MQIVLNHHKSHGSIRGLLLKPFVHKLFTECGVVGRMHNLQTNKYMGTVRLGPWKTQNVYQNHSEIQQGKDVYNIPVKRNEASIDAIVPSAGYLFQSARKNYGICLSNLKKGLDLSMNCHQRICICDLES